jgi:acetyltransferase-like isoleucine patch superfamily enzyme
MLATKPLRFSRIVRDRPRWIAAMVVTKAAQVLRIAWYRSQWTCAQIEGTPRLVAPVVLAGAGMISFGSDVTLGIAQSPGFLSGYCYIEARRPDSTVRIGDQTCVNNGVAIISEGRSITIGRRCLMGPGVQIYDSDFHALDVAGRLTGQPRMAEVVIEDDVFIGAYATVLKGVTVGAGSVIGAGAVVVEDVPENAIVAGNPAREIKR